MGMSQEGIYLIEVAEGFGYHNRCCTIERVEIVLVLEMCSYRHWTVVVVVDVDNVPLHWSAFMADTS